MKTIRLNGDEMKLNGNRLSGDTYTYRMQIKAWFDGKWDAETKTWVVNPEKVISRWSAYIKDADTAAATATITRTTTSTICPRCHTYCDGDCSAN